MSGARHNRSTKERASGKLPVKYQSNSLRIRNMVKIQSSRLVLSTESEYYGLETNVVRVDINTRNLGTQDHTFTIVVQQNHVGNHTIIGWPAGVQFFGNPVPAAAPGSRTIYQFFTQDWGKNWTVEVNVVGAVYATQQDIDDAVGDIDAALAAILQPET